VRRVRLKGKITWVRGRTAQGQGQQLRHSGAKEIVLNLRTCRTSTARSGEIVRTYTTVSARRQPQAAEPDQRITDLLSITKLLTVFETYDSENEAVRSFAASAKV